MKKNILELVKHPLIMGSSIVFVGSMGASVLNYLFNLATGRLLSVNDYGTFASLVSLFNIFSVFGAVITMVFSKLTASLVGQKKQNLIGSLFISGSIWAGIISLSICLILIAGSSQIASFLRINSIVLIIITILGLFFSFIGGVSAGILQGILKFNYSSLANITSSLVKLALGISLVLMGYRVFGAIMAFFISIVVSYAVALIPLRKYIRQSSPDGFTLSSLHKKAYSYALPVFFSNIGITAFISADIILVKHYFDPLVAGQYAALSLMGRVIFYFVSPISFVLFPLIAQKKERQERLTGTLILSALLIGLPSIALSLVYFMFPNLILRIFFPANEYLALASFLGPFSLFILFYSLSSLLNSFYLSIGKVKVLFFTIAAAVLEIAGIIFFHSSLTEVVNVLVAVSFLLLISLLLYYPNATEDSNS